MEIVRVIILEGEINDTLLSEMVMAMIHIKNLRPTRALKGSISPIKMQNQALPDLHPLRILGSNVYVFLHKKEQSLKSAKWKAHALWEKLVRFDNHIIYRVHIEDQNKVIWVQNPRIFEDITFKVAISLSDFEWKPMFGGVQIPDEQSLSDKNITSEEEKNIPKKLPQKLSKTRALKKVDRVSEEKNAPKQSPQKPIKNLAGRSIKPTPKSQYGNTIQTLVTQLTSLLDKDWEENTKVSAFLASFCDKD